MTTATTITEARDFLDFMGSREDAQRNDCAQDWDEAWAAAFPPTPTHFNLAGRDFVI